MSDAKAKLLQQIESAKKSLDWARRDLSEAEYLWRSMDRSYPDSYRGGDYWNVRDQLKGGYARLNSKHRSVERCERDLAALERELQRLEAEERESEGGQR
jgi:hypothetical protein